MSHSIEFVKDFYQKIVFLIFLLTSRTYVLIIIVVLFKEVYKMNSITDELISIEEARFALNCIRRHGFNTEEALESVDSLINRTRTVNMAYIVNYLIKNRLTPVQAEVVRLCCMEDISAAEAATRLGMSVRCVYSAKTKAKEILKNYLEVLIMYFKNLEEYEMSPLFIDETLDVLRAQKRKKGDISVLLKDLRTAYAIDTSQCAKFLNISEKKIQDMEQGKRSPTISEIQKYSRLTGSEIIIKITKGNGEFKWIKQ